MILNFDFEASIGPYKGIAVAYLFLSAVGRSSSTVAGSMNLTVARSLSIFFR